MQPVTDLLRGERGFRVDVGHVVPLRQSAATARSSNDRHDGTVAIEDLEPESADAGGGRALRRPDA